MNERVNSVEMHRPNYPASPQDDSNELSDSVVGRIFVRGRAEMGVWVLAPSRVQRRSFGGGSGAKLSDFMILIENLFNEGVEGRKAD